MHFLNKTLGFLAVFAGVPMAYAVTARPSVIGKVAGRMPTITTTVRGPGTTTSTTTSAALLDNLACIDAYTSCMKGADACGPNFEECTNRVLFQAKMPQCISTLAQCNATGIQSLFGTSTTTALSNVKTTNTHGEVTDYTYPADGTVLGQMITGAAISNQYNTSDCVRRYTSCLQRDSVCGSDFELCTTNNEFKKQMVFCDSTLARCQSDGKIELFGSNNTTVAPSTTSRLGIMINEGAQLAATNAVSTCYKVVDQCILGACAKNPYRCYAGATFATVTAAEEISGTTAATAATTATDASSIDTIANADVAKYIKSACFDTVAQNKFCYATFVGDGAMPTSSQLRDETNQEDIFSDAYTARMVAVMPKIADAMTEFDTRAKNKCVETIKSCAMRTCGGGSGAACYSQVFGATQKSINNSISRQEIKTGCAAVINTDPNCKYAAANPDATGTTTYAYTYMNGEAFDVLFPEYDDNNNSDPIGAVASLNASLASNYSDAAIAQMRRQCQSVATSCVKSLCGTDYQNCYRNRTDIYSSLTNTGEDAFDKSMNKVGGVLDYTIVLGLCLDTVKNASVCEEHLAIEQNKLKINKELTSASSWGTNSVRADWIDAGSATELTLDTQTVEAIDEYGNPLCTTKGGTDQAVCYTVDAQGNVYDQPVMISYTNYVQTQAASTLFKDLIYDLEKEAQAKYNAKLTKQQNLCMSSNNGGIIGNKDLGSTFMWVKLKSNKVPANYAVAGLNTNQFVASNDLYGSFCRIRVTLQSDDKAIQDTISQGSKWATAYFAAGDAFTCGSWIPNEELEKIANAVAAEKTGTDADGKMKTGQQWAVAGLTLLGGGAGAGITDVLQTQTGLGGLLKTVDNDKNKETKEWKNKQTACESAIKANIDTLTAVLNSTETNATVGRLVDGIAITGPEGAGDLKTKTFYQSASGTDQRQNIEDHIGALNQGYIDVCKQGTDYEMSGGKWSDGVTGRAVMDTVGAVTGGTMMGIGSWQIMKSVNRANFTKAQTEWMDNVGSKIRCFIGGEEVGMYGDIISTSME